MSTRYFVTGASGLLGHFLVPCLAMGGHEVVGLTNMHDLPGQHPAIRQVKGDITDRQALEGLLAAESPDVIIHAAGMTSVDQCELDPARARLMNTDVPAWIAQWTHEKRRRYVFISSDHVTGGAKPKFSEDDAVAPVNMYARSKAEAETAVMASAPDALVVRTNFFGRGPSWRKSITDWLWEKATTGESIPAFTDSYFSPISVYGLSQAIMDLSQGTAHGLFHVGGAERVSKYDFARRFLEYFQFDELLAVPSAVKDAHLAAPRPVDMSMAVDKVERVLGYGMPTLSQSFETIKNDYKR